MPAKVTLQVTKGGLHRREFVFAEHTTCIIGRAQDCDPRIPDDAHHKRISRHHCLLDINPPDIRVRDFGSLNGTYVNGKMIGQREARMTPEEGTQMDFPEYDLHDGDEIALSDTVLRVSVYVPAVCAECAAEIPEHHRAQARRTPDLYQCEACRAKAARVRRKEPPKKQPKVCAKCGKDVAHEMGEHRQGAFLCATCQSDPLQILQHLLALAREGDQQLLAIQGYTILQELGRGGMGAVYLARHDKTRTQIALKVMLPQVAVEARAREDFLRETENTRALKHPHVVQLHDAGCSNGTFFFTVEYCAGGSVADLMEQHGGILSVDDASTITLQALEGLHYAHNAEVPCVKLADGRIGRGRGLVHRDIKPSNIFLNGSGRARMAKVGDYGLAKAFDTAGLSGQTRTGSMAGTPHFMPRQQVVNFKYARPEVDVWAMAASLYNMLTGCVPRDFPKGKDRWQVVLQTAPVPIRKRQASIPKRLAEVIDLALVDQPSLHFTTAAAFKQALESAL